MNYQHSSFIFWRPTLRKRCISVNTYQGFRMAPSQSDDRLADYARTLVCRKG